MVPLPGAHAGQRRVRFRSGRLVRGLHPRGVAYAAASFYEGELTSHTHTLPLHVMVRSSNVAAAPHAQASANNQTDLCAILTITGGRIWEMPSLTRLRLWGKVH